MRFQPQPLTPFRSARHFYGAELRRCREEAGLSLAQLSGVVSAGKSTLARIETAEIMPPPGLSSQLDAAFGTDGHFVRLYDLARREAHPDQYRRYMDFEREAVGVAHSAVQLVPGVLQTEAYARAIFRTAAEANDEVVEERVAARLARQQRMRGTDVPRLWVVLDEAVISRPVGGAAVMAEQLACLLAYSAHERVNIQVAPFSMGGHYLLGGSLTLLELPSGRHLAWEEGVEVGRLYEEEGEVRGRRLIYDVLRANSLSLTESAALIRRTMERFRL
ncbi:helix-turn-helix domain-containing protein [Streptomyces sulphureus]|uniref:helix-turn-helix domain-containing protein n=1 Tax=Streptomyces sulphureus TaxID=47758 RepID=UPI0003694F6A|nr:helix-turn-helix transcriptional regulator [Streptomyces sulphureus]